LVNQERQHLSPAEAQKRAAGRRAAEYVQDGQIVGIGTGTTVRYVIEALAERIRGGMSMIGIATSSGTEMLAHQLGVPLLDLDSSPGPLDLCIDGADEVDPSLNLIKGLGAALLREKIVAAAAQQFIVVADASKRVRQLGEKAPVPVAIFSFGWTTTQARLARLCSRADLRQRDGPPVVTDDGLYIVDCYFGPIADPRALERTLHDTVGVAATGLFLDWPAPITALIAREDLSVEVLTR
jgi:ribose 5-phosphate isomerase A